MASRLLVVDDEMAVRQLLEAFLQSQGFEVSLAGDGVEALELMEKESFDLVLSDIGMPRMNGIELLENVQQKYPGTKRVLITSYEVEDYFQMALEREVGNIIPKGASFKLDDVERVVRSVLDEDFFGLDRHLQPGTTIHAQKIQKPDQIEEYTEKIAAACEDAETAGKIRMVVNELLTNAVFYGARNEDGDKKEEWDRSFTLSEQEAVELCWARDGEKVGLSVADPFGKLKKKEVLYWLSRQATTDSEGLPVGVFDTHGRGLYIARSQVDSLIINIKPGHRTEIVALLYKETPYQGAKPLHINEA